MNLKIVAGSLAIAGLSLLTTPTFGADCSMALADSLRAIRRIDWDELDGSERALEFEELTLQDFQRELETKLPAFLRFNARTVGQEIVLFDRPRIPSTELLTTEQNRLVVSAPLVIHRRASPFARAVREFCDRNGLTSLLFRFHPRTPEFDHRSSYSMFAWQYYSFEHKDWSHLTLDIENDGYILGTASAASPASADYMILSWSKDRIPGPWSK